jgi:hypothetical protein
MVSVLGARTSCDQTDEESIAKYGRVTRGDRKIDR